MIEQDFIDRMSFHHSENIVEIDLEGFTFKDFRDTDVFHDALDRVIAETGRTWYFLTNFVDCEISPAAALQFSVRRAHSQNDHSLAAVRYGASEEVELALASRGSDPKAVTRSFASREEALLKIEELKTKAVFQQQCV